ncbi:MAG: hypothetical protein HRT63_13360 [Erythrobacter sp.]|nr:hypothetical protein [Erythrobacter sp.]
MAGEKKGESGYEKLLNAVIVLSISFAAVMLGFNSIQSMTHRSEEIKALKSLDKTLNDIKITKSNTVSQGETK